MATYVTAVRTVLATALAALSIGRSSAALLVAALAAYWIGDILDGWIARRTDTETRDGAVLDILCDRLCVALIYVAYLHREPHMAVPVAIFLVQFMVLDAHLSLAFLRWPLRSPNYFWVVDRAIYRWNWSPVAKATNSGALLVLMVGTGSWVLAAVLAGTVGVVKTASLLRLQTIVPPLPTGCAGKTAQAGSG